MNSCSSFHSNQHLQNNRIETVEKLRHITSCLRHHGNDLISICFYCKVDSEVFHCKICEEECFHDQFSHVNLSHLNQDVIQETVIPNWPVLSQHVLSRIQAALQFSFEGEREQIYNDDTTINRLKQQQLLLQEAYNQFSQQKQFRDILLKNNLDHQEKSMLFIQVINFTKEYQKEIDEEFLSLLDDFESLGNKDELNQDVELKPSNCGKEQNKMIIEQQHEDNSEYLTNNSISQKTNRQIKLKISRLNELQTYENIHQMKKKESIIYEISRMPNLSSLKLNLQQTIHHQHVLEFSYASICFVIHYIFVLNLSQIIKC